MEKVDTFLEEYPDIALLVRQIEELMELYQRLVAEGKIPAYKLMGLENGLLSR